MQTIYANAAIAALMSQWFVNIKVDREERPDIDETYMLARNLLTGSGGWPNNLFLTPDLKPFFAGSYFPPDNTGSLGFPGILRIIHTTWERQPAKVNGVANGGTPWRVALMVAAARSRSTGPAPARGGELTFYGNLTHIAASLHAISAPPIAAGRWHAFSRAVMPMLTAKFSRAISSIGRPQATSAT